MSLTPRQREIGTVFQKAYEDALKHGSGFYQTRFIAPILQAKHVRHSDVFRFRFIRGKSHAHSRKIWRERSRRSLTWGSLRVTYDLPPLSADQERIGQSISRRWKARLDAEIVRALFAGGSPCSPA